MTSALFDVGHRSSSQLPEVRKVRQLARGVNRKTTIFARYREAGKM